MYLPCESSVSDAISSLTKSIKAACKKKSKFGIKKYTIEQCDENPNVFSVAAIDNSDYANVGMVAYDIEKKDVSFFCYNSLTGNHDQMEGIPEEDSRCWWDAKESKIFLMFLTGEVREIMEKNYKANT
jgi:hypothetical protein